MGQAAGQEQTDAGQEQGHAQRAQGDVAPTPGQGLVDGGQRERGPQHAHHAVAGIQGDRHVAGLSFQRVALAERSAYFAGQGRQNLGPRGIVVQFHLFRLFEAIAHHLAVGKDYGEPRAGLLGDPFTAGIDCGKPPGNEQIAKGFFQEQGLRLQLIGRMVNVEAVQGREAYHVMPASESSVTIRYDG